MTEISITGGSVDEADFNFVEFIIELSEPALDAVTVSYRTLRGTALDDDFDSSVLSSANNGFITFAPGETSKSIFIEANSDSIDERDEAFTLELYNPTDNATFEGGVPVLRSTGIFLDNDGVGSDLAVFVGSPVLTEADSGQTFAVFEVTLSQPAGSSTTMTYTTADISAKAGSDYIAQAGSITFETGQQTAFVSVAVIGDEVGEGAETFALIVTPSPSDSIGTDGAVGEALILDTDTSALPEVSIAGDVVDEADFQYLRFVVTLSEPAFDAVTVEYQTLRGTALDDDLDSAFTSGANTGSLTFAPGQTSLEIIIESNTDTLDERDEDVTLELFNLTENAVFAGDTPVLRATGIILDDDGVGSNLAVFVGDPVLTEADSGQTMAVFDITMSRPALTEFTLDFTTADISAIAGEDYVATSGTISFEPGQMKASVAVPVIGDTVAEAAESFALIVTAPNNVSVGTDGAVGEALILDSDASVFPEISVAGDVVEENDFQYLRFNITLSEPSIDVVTVNYRTLRDTALDDDLDSAVISGANNGIVTFAPGETTAVVIIESNSDGLDERDENITLELYDPSANAVLDNNAPVLRATGVILDNDGVGSNLALFVGDPVLTEADSGQTEAVFEILLSQPAPTGFVIEYETKDITAVAGEDYIPQSGSISFAPGQVSASVSVPVLGDLMAEGAERFGLSVTLPNNVSIDGTGAFGEALILDTDTSSLPEISIEGDVVDEADFQYMRFVVTLSETSLDTVTVQYSTFGGNAEAADLDSGFVSGTVTFEPGQTSREIIVEANTDALDERDESLYVRLFDPTNATFNAGQDEVFATGFVLDDDGLGPNIAVAGETAILAEGPVVDAVYFVEVELSQATENALAFDVSLIGIDATIGADIYLIDTVVSFDPGQTTAAVRVGVAADNAVEGNEVAELTFTPTVDTPFAGTIPNTTLTITDTVGQDGTPNGQTLTGNVNPNEIFGADGDDAIYGFGGDDTLGGSTGNDSVFGGNGADQVFGAADNDVLYGEAGADLLGGFDGDDYLDGGADNDTIYGAADQDTLIGGDGDDLLGGFTGNDLLFGGSGLDQLYGSFGDDTLYGGDDDDLLGGFDGNDSLDGQGGNDDVFGGAGDDTVLGGDGDDLLGGFTGNDLLKGGNGLDEIYGADGFDTIFGGADDDAVGGGLDDDIVDGGSGDDQVSGGGGNDVLLGGTGNDDLFGAGGDDTLDGGAGDDEMFGGAGADDVIFSTGADTFFFFSTAEDQVDLSGVVSIINFTDLTDNHLTDVAGSATITDDLGNTLTLDGIAIGLLDEDNFIF